MWVARIEADWKDSRGAGMDHRNDPPTERHRSVTGGVQIQSPLVVWSPTAEPYLILKWL